ncbi:MAG: hypothetical protein OXF27_08675 [Acidobacteria bacterium]|nr:hypothetical protein [Acidobacteriota bacterium]
MATSHSILQDGDIDLGNQFAPGGGFLFQGDLRAASALPGTDGRLYPSQSLAVGIAAAPLFAAATAVASVLPPPFLEAVRWNEERAARDMISAPWRCSSPGLECWPCASIGLCAVRIAAAWPPSRSLA